MKMALVWFFLSCKRYLKKPGILLALLLLPVTAWIAGKYISTEGEGIKIALYLQETVSEKVSETADLKTGSEENKDQDQNWKNMGDQLAEDLLNNSGMFQFYLCDDEEKLKDQVASGKAECGYVIPEDLGERLKDKKIKKAMTLYTSPSTVTGSLSTETVFAALAKLYDRQLLIDYVQDEEAGDLYDLWYADGNIFHFEYVYGDSSYGGSGTAHADTSDNIFPVKGITAVIIFMMSLYSACILKEDEKKGLFSTLISGEKQKGQMAVFLALPVLSVISGILALYAGGVLKSSASGMIQLEKLTELLLYSAASCLFAWILKLLVRNSKVLFCLIPFFLMGSLIFTPVFFDIGRWVPSLQWIGRLFLPYYYLH